MGGRYLDGLYASAVRRQRRRPGGMVHPGKIKPLQLLLCRCAACGNVIKLGCVCSGSASALTADAAGWAASNGLKCACAYSSRDAGVGLAST